MKDKQIDIFSIDKAEKEEGLIMHFRLERIDEPTGERFEEIHGLINFHRGRIEKLRGQMRACDCIWEEVENCADCGNLSRDMRNEYGFLIDAEDELATLWQRLSAGARRGPDAIIDLNEKVF